MQCIYYHACNIAKRHSKEIIIFNVKRYEIARFFAHSLHYLSKSIYQRNKRASRVNHKNLMLRHKEIDLSIP